MSDKLVKILQLLLDFYYCVFKCPVLTGDRSWIIRWHLISISSNLFNEVFQMHTSVQLRRTGSFPLNNPLSYNFAEYHTELPPTRIEGLQCGIIRKFSKLYEQQRILYRQSPWNFDTRCNNKKQERAVKFQQAPQTSTIQKCPRKTAQDESAVQEASTIYLLVL